MLKTAHTGYMMLSEAARELGQSESTVRRLADAGRVRSFRDLKNHRIVVREDIERLVRARKRDGR